MSLATGPQAAAIRILQTVEFGCDYMMGYGKDQGPLWSARIHISYACTYNTAPHYCVCKCCQVQAAVSPKRTARMGEGPVVHGPSEKPMIGHGNRADQNDSSSFPLSRVPLAD